MISPEDVKLLVTYLHGGTVDNDAIAKLTKKLELIEQQIEIQESQREALLKIREELEALDKDDKKA